MAFTRGKFDGYQLFETSVNESIVMWNFCCVYLDKTSKFRIISVSFRKEKTFTESTILLPSIIDDPIIQALLWMHGRTKVTCILLTQTKSGNYGLLAATLSWLTLTSFNINLRAIQLNSATSYYSLRPAIFPIFHLHIRPACNIMIQTHEECSSSLDIPEDGWLAIFLKFIDRWLPNLTTFSQLARRIKRHHFRLLLHLHRAN